MKQLLVLCDDILRFATKAASYTAGVFILLIAFFVVYEIVMRGIFHSPTEWVLEISVYLMLAAGFLGLAVTQQAHAHVKVDLFVGMLSPKMRIWADILASVSAIIFCVVFIEQSFDMVMTSFEFDRTSPSTLRFPLYIPQTSLVIGGALLLLQFMRQLLVKVGELRGGAQQG